MKDLDSKEEAELHLPGAKPRGLYVTHEDLIVAVRAVIRYTNARATGEPLKMTACIAEMAALESKHG